MSGFLSNADNKTSLNLMISKYAVDPLRCRNHNVVISTTEGNVLTSNDGIQSLEAWIPETHEEADNRILLHIRDPILNHDQKTFIVRSVDTDVMIIILSFMPQFLEYSSDVRIFVMLGRGTDKKIYSANDIYNEVGESCCLGLPFFHAFTGCDSTSAMDEKRAHFRCT